jgi:hypothetical protein
MVDPCRKTERKRAAGNCESESSTQTFRFIPFTDNLSANLGYSVSLFQRVVQTVRYADQRKHLACDLRALAIGGIDLLVGLVMVGELNST